MHLSGVMIHQSVQHGIEDTGAMNESSTGIQIQIQTLEGAPILTTRLCLGYHPLAKLQFGLNVLLIASICFAFH